jgi:two-component system nitrate/nitrite response regulator NarL
VREGLRSLLLHADFTIMGEARSVAEAVSLIDPAMLPHVMLIDLPSGANSSEYFAEIAMLVVRLPDVRVVLFGEARTEEWLAHCIEAKVDGCLSRDVSPAALRGFIRLILAGEKVFSSDLVRVLLDRQPGERVRVRRNADDISEQERQVLRCLVGGLSNKTIAQRLHVSEATIKVRMKGLLRKINASNRTQAAIWALDHGIAVGEDDKAF